MDDTIFCERFRFYEITRDTYHYSDNRDGSPEHYLACMLSGHCKIISDERHIEVSEGDVFYIPRGLPYQSYWYGDPEIRFLSYGFQLFPDAEHTRFSLQTIKCSEELATALQAVPVGQPPSSAALGAFYTVLAQLLPHMSTDALDRDEQLLRKARQYLYDHPGSTALQTARQLGISESTLYAIFKHCAGKTPNVVRQEILCEKAVFLLSTTDKTVQAISDELGFSSTSYFRKILKAHTGMSPRAIRRTAGSV